MLANGVTTGLKTIKKCP